MLYKQKTHEILSYLYQLRVLSHELLFEYFFSSQGLTSVYFYKVLQEMGNHNLIHKQVLPSKDVVYSISRKGVDFLRLHGILLIGDEIPTIKDDFLTPCKIKLKDVAIPHQLHLNHFILRFRSEFPDMEFEYYDEKYVSMFPDIRPDGLIKLGNHLYFLEMDMGTERQSALIKKWNNYRAFLNSTYYYQLKESITVLFITNTKSKTRNKKLQSYIAPYLLDKISIDFNIYLGDEDSLIRYLHQQINETDVFPKALSHFARTRYYTTDGLEGFVFDSYLALLENGFIKNKNGEYFEFLYDDFLIDNMYVYRKLSKMKLLSSSMFQNLNRTMKYLIYISTEKEAFDLLKRTDSFPFNVYFLTPERLRSSSFFEALFQISRDGILYHFANDSLDVKIKEFQFSSFSKDL